MTSLTATFGSRCGNPARGSEPDAGLIGPFRSFFAWHSACTGSRVAMKTHKIEYDERRSLASAVEQLQSVVDGLRARALTIAHGDRRLLFLLAPGSPLELSLQAERSGDRERLEISLEWRRQHLRIDGAALSETTSSEALLPEAGALEEEQLEEESDSQTLDENGAPPENEDDDGDDEAETVRQGSNLLAQALH